MPDLSGFAAMILTHGRPGKVQTYESLRRHGYTGRIVLLIDDEDPTGPEYRERYGDEVVTFSKSDYQHIDIAAQAEGPQSVVVYARVASFDVARSLGLTHFIQLDDDYNGFWYRLLVPETAPLWERRTLPSKRIGRLDDVFVAMLDLLEGTDALTVAMGQGGEYIGGPASHLYRLGLKRKAMNSFVVRTDRPIPFVGRLNEDVNAYALGGSRGELYFTVADVCLVQMQTQQNSGGLTEAYLEVGTYVKSFYTVLMCPSFVSIRSMGPSDRRFHHHIDWEHGIPKILAPEYRHA